MDEQTHNLRAGAAAEVAASLEHNASRLSLEPARYEGEARALRKAAQRVESEFMARAKTQLSDEVWKEIHLYLRGIAGTLHTMAQDSERAALIAEGQVKGLLNAAKVAERHVEIERGKQALAAEEEAEADEQDA